MPGRSTAWKLLAQGLTAETLAGDASDELVVKKDLFGEIKLPLAFTNGDMAEIPVTVHNDAVERARSRLCFGRRSAARRFEETKRIEASSKGLHEVRLQGGVERP